MTKYIHNNPVTYKATGQGATHETPLSPKESCCDLLQTLVGVSRVYCAKDIMTGSGVWHDMDLFEPLVKQISAEITQITYRDLDTDEQYLKDKLDQIIDLNGHYTYENVGAIFEDFFVSKLYFDKVAKGEWNKHHLLSIPVKIPYTIDNDLIESFLYDMWQTSAYWCDEIKEQNGVSWKNYTDPNWELLFLVEGRWRKMNMTKVKKNLKVFVNYCNGKWWRQHQGSSDFTTIDCLVQAIVLGKIIYG